MGYRQQDQEQHEQSGPLTPWDKIKAIGRVGAQWIDNKVSRTAQSSVAAVLALAGAWCVCDFPTLYIREAAALGLSLFAGVLAIICFALLCTAPFFSLGENRVAPSTTFATSLAALAMLAALWQLPFGEHINQWHNNPVEHAGHLAIKESNQRERDAQSQRRASRHQLQEAVRKAHRDQLAHIRATMCIAARSSESRMHYAQMQYAGEDGSHVDEK